MNIAVTNALLPSEQHAGVPYQVHQLANALCARGHAVTVFSFSPRPADARYRLHQFTRPRVPARYLPFFMAYRLARTDFTSFDVVSVHGDNYLLGRSTPVVRTFHGTAADELKNARTLRRKLFFLLTIVLERIGAARATYVVGISEGTRSGMPGVRAVIPCGVDLAAFAPGAKSERPTVLFVGTEGGRKRGAWLADIFTSKVLPSVPDAELRMVCEATGTAPGVRRYGRVSTGVLAELYGSAWAFCLPSTYEGFGVPYIEAMAARTAVVATSPNAGAREVLGDGAYGSYVADADLAAELTRILSDAAHRADLEHRGAERARDFAWDRIAAQYEAVFAEVLG